MADAVLAGSVVVIAVAVVAGAAVFIPALRQVHRTAARFEALVARYEDEVGPLVAQAKMTLAEMERSAAKVETVTRGIDRAVQVVDSLARIMAGVRITVGRTIPPVATAAAAVEGVRQAVQYLFGARTHDGRRSERKIRDEREEF